MFNSIWSENFFNFFSPLKFFSNTTWLGFMKNIKLAIFRIAFKPLRSVDKHYMALGMNYSTAGFELILTRKMSFYIITYYLPSGLFVGISWVRWETETQTDGQYWKAMNISLPYCGNNKYQNKGRMNNKRANSDYKDPYLATITDFVVKRTLKHKIWTWK